MENANLYLRPAVPEDAEQIRDIYAPYLEHTVITFEYELPSVEEFKRRIETTLQKYPYLAAVTADGTLLGYAYTGPFIGRAAYGWGAETSIYLRQDRRNMGIGKKLYQAIEEISKAQNILNLNACIGYPEQEDEYLTKNSAQFHAHLGYSLVGRFHQCGYKFGRWYHMIWMEKLIGEHKAEPLPVIPFRELGTDVLRAAGLHI